jgi:hypothetical protein
MCNSYDEVSQKLYNYIVSSCMTESKAISSSLYSDLYGQTSTSRYFQNPDLVNAFYTLDVRSHLEENCRFEITAKFDYTPKDIRKTSLIVSGGIAVVGSVFSLIILTPIGIVPSVVLGAVAYPITSKIMDRKNFEDYLFNVEVYLKELKKKFLTWVESFEDYYSLTVEGLLKQCS